MLAVSPFGPWLRPARMGVTWRPFAPDVPMATALIAEDEPMLRAQLKSRLRQAWPELGDIVEAENGEQALALIDDCRPDVAFLDIRMPVQSGLDVARATEGRCHVVCWVAAGAGGVGPPATSCSSPPTTSTRSLRSTRARSITC